MNLCCLPTLFTGEYLRCLNFCPPIAAAILLMKVSFYTHVNFLKFSLGMKHIPSLLPPRGMLHRPGPTCVYTSRTLIQSQAYSCPHRRVCFYEINGIVSWRTKISSCKSTLSLKMLFVHINCESQSCWRHRTPNSASGVLKFCVISIHSSLGIFPKLRNLINKYKSSLVFHFDQPDSTMVVLTHSIKMTQILFQPIPKIQETTAGYQITLFEGMVLKKELKQMFCYNLQKR